MMNDQDDDGHKYDGVDFDHDMTKEEKDAQNTSGKATSSKEEKVVKEENKIPDITEQQH